ncbi:uncharacterized protein LOC130647822 [Hydractinia symbiolongicarpus]|uniref:uncharacterized protein LOC130647822 n=1 Tax=Hydractinia symbiolongicarpus TaxID=13093 RepID=UPI0025502575|nr:uncharacterized protein LOC130647822 [Hydractinia symbiolongicarpus]
MFIFLKIAVFTLQILFVWGGYYTLDDELPDGGVTKYFKNCTEVSCLLQCEREKQCDRIMFKLHNKQMRNGECWFVKNTTDKGEEMQTLKKDKSIKSYQKTTPECPSKAKCYYGNCAITNDLKGYNCECQDDWILLKSNVCFGARANQYGTFNIQYDAYMTGIKLVHVGGNGVTCLENVALTKWGCDSINQYSNKYVSVVITNYQNNVLYPYMGHLGEGFYSVPGYNANSPYLIFGGRNYTVYRNKELRIHYGETLMGYHQKNNGTSCADIYAKLCDV